MPALHRDGHFYPVRTNSASEKKKKKKERDCWGPQLLIDGRICIPGQQPLPDGHQCHDCLVGKHYFSGNQFLFQKEEKKGELLKLHWPCSALQSTKFHIPGSP